MPRPPVRVAVLIDLERGPCSGGHVKCWERFADAAAGHAELDLTLFTLTRPDQPAGAVERVADNVRFEALAPVWSTRRLGRLVGGVDASDLAPHHPSLARRIGHYDVWHVTHTMAFASTAARLARRAGRRSQLVASVHTDVPTLTRLYTSELLTRYVSAGRLLRAARVHDLAGRLARRRRNVVLGACSTVLTADDDQARELSAHLPRWSRLGPLRRGIDTARFAPDRAARERVRAVLRAEHALPPHAPVVLFVGRVDESKRVSVVAEAVRRLQSDGTGPHLLVAGEGAAAPAVRRLLGNRATLLGHVPQNRLHDVYAAADVLAFPSRSETSGNVVAEAMASGCPVVLPMGASTTQWLRRPGHDGVVVAQDDPNGWTETLGRLLGDTRYLSAVGSAGRDTALARHPSWQAVLEEDLLPVWLRAG